MNAAKVTLTATILAAALGLALVFSVSSVEARKLCEPCQKCDKDGDGLIDNRDFCLNKCDGNPDTDDSDAVGLCPVPDDGSFISLFTVELTEPGPVTGGPTNWNGSTSGGRTIHLPLFNPLNMALDLGFFADFPDVGDGVLCFPVAASTILFAASLESKNIKGGETLQAIGKFWFEGETSVADDGIDVSYVFNVFGTLSDDNNWPGDNILTMTDWIMKVETTTKGGRKIACTSEGSFSGEGVGPVIINVLQTQ